MEKSEQQRRLLNVVGDLLAEIRKYIAQFEPYETMILETKHIDSAPIMRKLVLLTDEVNKIQ